MKYPILSLVRRHNEGECVIQEDYEEFPEFYLPGCLNEDFHLISRSAFENSRCRRSLWHSPDVVDYKTSPASHKHEAGHMIDFWRRRRVDALLNCVSFSEEKPGVRPSVKAAQIELNVTVYTQKLDEYLDYNKQDVFHFDLWKSSDRLLSIIYRMMFGNDNFEPRNIDKKMVRIETAPLVENSQLLFDNITPEEVYQSWKEVCAFLKPYHEEFSEKHLTPVGS